jgi:competence protein ComFB
MLRNYHNICKCNRCQLDMIAYALNKLPPKYIVSERGLTHLAIEDQYEFQQYADIIGTVNSAIEVISSRVRPEYEHKKQEVVKQHDAVEESKDFYFNFPHLIGEVYADDALNVKPGITVTLSYNNKQAHMADASWMNPYVTSNVTGAFYNFWPAPLLCEGKKSIAKVFKFDLLFELKGYKNITKQVQFRIFCEKKKYNYIRGNFVKKIPPVCLAKK